MKEEQASMNISESYSSIQGSDSEDLLCKPVRHIWLIDSSQNRILPAQCIHGGLMLRSQHSASLYLIAVHLRPVIVTPGSKGKARPSCQWVSGTGCPERALPGLDCLAGPVPDLAEG